MKRFYVLILSLVASLAMAAPPTVTISSSALSGDSPLTLTLNWSSSGAQACSAQAVPTNSQWTGPVAVNGSKTITGVTANTIFLIGCADAGDVEATFNWTRPTLNTDGTALTDLKEYKLYDVANAAATSGSLLATVPEAFTTATIGGFAAGLHYFKISSVNQSNQEGPLSNAVSKLFVAPETVTSQVSVTVAKKPMAPVLTVQ